MARHRPVALLVLCTLCSLSFGPAMLRVLVTGGNKGIGRALCRQLAADHGFYVLMGARDPQRGEAAVKSILEESPDCEGRIECLPLDVASDKSVKAAADFVQKKFGADPPPLYGIVNNAGVGFDHSMLETVNINTLGAKRVCESFIPLLDKEGRIVNTASASGPNYVSRCGGAERQLLTKPDVTWEELGGLIEKVNREPGGRQPYGFSKACLISYTMLLARENPQKINAMTPGYILTDITRGMGATKSPEEGTKAAIHCLMGKLEGNGWYYGSDAVRSPIDRYRGPGEPPYEGD
ncbi:unnamed protein product [Effrenium voratum]|nr:unnamed protein product [Effrenium voratum]